MIGGARTMPVDDRTAWSGHPLWQDLEEPQAGGYDLDTPVYYWDGKPHEWGGMSVPGMEYQDDFERGCGVSVYWKPEHSNAVIKALAKYGHTPEQLSRCLGKSKTWLELRLYETQYRGCQINSVLWRMMKRYIETGDLGDEARAEITKNAVISRRKQGVRSECSP